MIRPGLATIAAVLLAGCFDGSVRCGESTPAGACLSVLSVVPESNGVQTSNVDVVQGKCGDPAQPMSLTPEPFRDHDATFTLSNAGPVAYHDEPGMAPAVVITGYSVSFANNTNCNGCPALDPIQGLGPTATVLGGQEVQISFPLMPLRTKKEFLDKGGDADEVPSYSATYKLTGQDAVDKFTIEGAVSFTVGNFNYCGM